MFLAVVAVIGFCALFPAVPIFVFSVVAFYYGVHLLIGAVGWIIVWFFNGGSTSSFEERKQRKFEDRLERIREDSLKRSQQARLIYPIVPSRKSAVDKLADFRL